MTETSQRRGLTLAMTAAEVDLFLRDELVCRVATTGPAGPHLSPLWFVWDGGALWLYSLTRSQRWTDLQRDPSVAVLVDAGTAYDELRGVELRGRVRQVGEVPRTGLPTPQPEPELELAERLFARKYGGTELLVHDGRHAWLVLRPDAVLSWDFRKRAAQR